MLKRLFLLFSLLVVFSGCASDAPDIRVNCQRDDIGNYIVKWETYPQLQGTLKLYVSDNPENIDQGIPAAYANIADGRVTYVTNDNVTRKYFLLSFNDKYFVKVGSRLVNMETVQNMRDLGGYRTTDNKTIRWGKLFRSGNLTIQSELDSLRFNNLGIKTIIDFRINDEPDLQKHGNAEVKKIIIPVGDTAVIFEKIREGRLRKGDGIIFMQDMYLKFSDDHSKQFSEAFDLLLDKDNYPILFDCELGKDRSGFFAALLLLALGVPESTVMQDYMLTNEFLDLRKFDNMAKNLDQEAQETIALLLTANETYLNTILLKIRKEYGTFQNYFAKELNLTEKERAVLKENLLY